MANKQYLNYDPDTNQLYLCDNCETNPVYTKTTFNTDSLSVHDDDYCLYMKAVDGHEYKISESLLGPKGDQGDKGNDGNDGEDGATIDNVLDSLAVYHLELSNDMDQVYVKDDYSPVIALTISTNITLYKNGSFADLEDENSKWEFVILDTSDYTERKIEDRKASFTYNPSKKVSDSSRVYIIKAVLKDKEDDSVLREVIKDFKVKRIVGTTDYDLHVTPGVLKIKADDSSATDSVSVKIKCREISQVSNVQIITADALPSDYKVQYYWTINNEIKSKVELKGSSISVPTTDFKENSLLTVELLYNNEVVDVAYVECVRSGKDGKTSNHVELSNDYDQVYVTDGVTKFTFEYNINVSLYDGNDKLEINSSDVIIPKSESGLYSTTIHPVNKQTNEVPVTITINSGTVFTEKIKTIQIPIKVGELGAVKNFTLVKLSGEMDYDLYVKPDVVRLTQDENQNWVMDTDYFEILLWEKELGANAKAATQKDTLPSNYSIVVEGDGQPIDSLTKYGTSDSLAPSLGTYNIPLNEYGNAYKKLTVSLKCGDTLVDWAELAFLADGERGPQGERGLSGASSYYIDLSNDFDLLYFKDGQLLPGQTFNTEVRLYKGAQQHTIIDKSETPDDFTCTTINDKVIAGIECEVVDGVGHIDLNFDTINPTFPGKDLPKSFSYKVKLKQQVIENEGEPAREVELFKTIRLAAIEGTDDYDLKCNTTTISKDSTGQLYPNKPLPEISVTHRDLSGLKSSTTHLTTLDLIKEAGLSLKYQIDSEPEQDLGDVGVQENIQISTDIIKQVKDYMKVCLYKGDILLDYIYLDVVLDGANATLYYTDLSNDMDQIYVSESDNTLVDDINIYTDVSIYEGNTLIGIENIDWVTIDIPTDLDCASDLQKLPNGSVRIELKFTKGKPISFNSNSYTIPISVTQPGTESSQAFLSKKFIIKVFKGTESFDLLLNHEVVNINNSGQFTADNIVVKVMRTVYGANAIPPTPFDWSDTHIVRCVINGNYTDAFDLPCGGGSGTIFLNTIDFDNVSSPIIEFKLYPKDYTSDDQYIDSAEVVITRDGTDGTNASLLTVDFSNDLDLIYVGKNGVLYPNQTVQTGIKCFYGIEPISVNDYSITITPNSDEAPEPTVTENADDNSTTVTFNFTDTSTAITHPALYYTVSVNYNGQVFLKTYKILVLASDVGYDLHANRTRLRYKENKILNEGDLQISVNKRTFGSNTELSLSITQKSELPEGLTVYCGTTTDNTNILNSFTIGYGTYQSWTTPRYIRLVKDGLEIDQIVIDILKDGEKGNTGADGISVTMTPIQNIVYLNGDTSLATLLTVSFSVFAAQGTQKQTVSSVSVSGLGGSFSPTSKIWTWYPDTSTKFTSGIIAYTATISVNNVDYTTPIQIEFKQGYYGYNLVASPNCIKRSSDGTALNITFKVKRTITGGSIIEDLGYVTSYLALRLTLSVDDTSVNGKLLDQDEEQQWILDANTIGDSSLIEVSLKEGSTLVDVDFLTEVKDGLGVKDIPADPGVGDIFTYVGLNIPDNIIAPVYGCSYVSSYLNEDSMYAPIVPLVAFCRKDGGTSALIPVYGTQKHGEKPAWNDLTTTPIGEGFGYTSSNLLYPKLGDMYLTLTHQLNLDTEEWEFSSATVNSTSAFKNVQSAILQLITGLQLYPIGKVTSISIDGKPDDPYEGYLLSRQVTFIFDKSAYELSGNKDFHIQILRNGKRINVSKSLADILHQLFTINGTTIANGFADWIKQEQELELTFKLLLIQWTPNSSSESTHKFNCEQLLDCFTDGCVWDPITNPLRDKSADDQLKWVVGML